MRFLAITATFSTVFGATFYLNEAPDNLFSEHYMGVVMKAVNSPINKTTKEPPLTTDEQNAEEAGFPLEETIIHAHDENAPENNEAVDEDVPQSPLTETVVHDDTDTEEEEEVLNNEEVMEAEENNGGQQAAPHGLRINIPPAGPLPFVSPGAPVVDTESVSTITPAEMSPLPNEQELLEKPPKERARYLRQLYSSYVEARVDLAPLDKLISSTHYKEQKGDVPFELMNHDVILDILRFIAPTIPVEEPNLSNERAYLKEAFKLAGFPATTAVLEQVVDDNGQVINQIRQVPIETSCDSLLQSPVLNRKIDGRYLRQYFIAMIKKAQEKLHTPNVPSNENPFHILLQEAIDAAKYCEGRKLSFLQTYLKLLYANDITWLRLPPSAPLEEAQIETYYKIQHAIFAWFQDYKQRVFERHFFDASKFILAKLSKYATKNILSFAQSMFENMDHSRNYFATILSVYGINIGVMPDLKDIFWNLGRINEAVYLRAMPYLDYLLHQAKKPDNLLKSFETAVRLEPELQQFELPFLWREQLARDEIYLSVTDPDTNISHLTCSDVVEEIEREKMLRMKPFRLIEKEFRATNPDRVQFLTLVYWAHKFWEAQYFEEHQAKWLKTIDEYLRYFERDFLARASVDFFDKIFNEYATDGLPYHVIAEFLQQTGLIEADLDPKDKTTLQMFTLSEEDFLSPNVSNLEKFLVLFRLLEPKETPAA